MRAALVACGLLITAQAAAVTAPVDMREVVATGDLVPGLGRIGQFGIDLLGFDDQGRLLLGAQISDGRHGLFWADESRVAMLWTVGEPQHDPISLISGLATSSPNGRFVLALGSSDSSDPLSNRQDAMYLLRDRNPVRRLGADDVTDEGDHLCFFQLNDGAAVNDVGAFAFVGEAVTAMHSCDEIYTYRDPDDPNYVPLELIDGIWLAHDDKVERVVAIGDTLADDQRVEAFHLLGVSQDSTTIFQVASSVYARRDNETRRVLHEGDLGPSNGELKDIQPLAINGQGDILFLASEGGVDGLYRTHDSETVRVAGWPDAAPPGFQLYLDQNPGSLNDAGDVVLNGAWYEPTPDASGRQVYGIVAYPASGGSDLIRDGARARINRRGEIAFVTLRHGSTVSAVKRSNGRNRSIVTNGDAAPGGGHFGAQGFGNLVCFDDSGLVGLTAYTGDSTSGIVCASEQDGLTLIAKDGDPAPDGGFFESVDRCAFGADGEMFFVGSKVNQGVSQPGLYRATAAGIEPVLAGANLNPVWDLYGFGFRTNNRGTVAVLSYRNRGYAFLRQRPGGSIEQLFIADYMFPGDRRIDSVQAFALAADDRIVASVRFADERNSYPESDSTSVVVLDDTNQGTIIATRSDLAGGPFDGVGPIVVDGESVVIPTAGRFGSDNIFLYDLAAQTPAREVFGESSGLDQGSVLDVTANGDLLVYARRRSPPFEAATFLLAGGSPVELSRLGQAEPDARAISDHGNVLFINYQSRLGGYRYALSISGPPVTAQCPGQRAASSKSRSGGGCTMASKHETNAWILLALPLIFVARRRRGTHAMSGKARVSSAES